MRERFYRSLVLHVDGRPERAPVLCLAAASAAEAVPSADVLISSEEVSIASQPDVNVKWYFKTENGKLYKRLWDVNVQIWLTDWIYVRDL